MSSIFANGVRCYLCTKSVITFLSGADLIIVYRLGLIHYFYVLNIYKFVTINMFDCYYTIAYIDGSRAVVV